jgi:hypothetical protein
MPNLSYVTTGLAALSNDDPIDDNLCLWQQTVIDPINSVPSHGAGGIVRDICSIFGHCPNLHTFCFNVSPTVGNEALHPSLRVIVLQITPVQWIDEEVLERSLQTHIKTITGESFPALRRVISGVVEIPLTCFNQYVVT